jgi:hypothetical protein
VEEYARGKLGGGGADAGLMWPSNEDSPMRAAAGSRSQGTRGAPTEGGGGGWGAGCPSGAARPRGLRPPTNGRSAPLASVLS